MSPAIGVLVCDDVPALRALLRYGLEDEEDLAITGEAGDGQEALARVRRAPPDAVLLDLSMPGMDGLEALPLLREAAPRAGIVVLSGLAADRMEAPAMAAGADRYLEKGASMQDIANALRAAVAARRGG